MGALEHQKEDGTPYKVFTPFYRKGCLKADIPREPLSKSEDANHVLDEGRMGIDRLELLPKINWDSQLEPYWKIGEEGAHRRFQAFIDEGLPPTRMGATCLQNPVSRVCRRICILVKYRLTSCGMQYKA